MKEAVEGLKIKGVEGVVFGVVGIAEHSYNVTAGVVNSWILISKLHNSWTFPW